MPETGWTAYGGGSVENWKCTIKTDNKKDGPLRLTQGPTFFICGVVISARQKFALVFSLIFSLNTLLPAVSLWYGLVQRNAPNPCSTRLSGIVWYGLVGPDMAFGQIQVLYRPPLFKLGKHWKQLFSVLFLAFRKSLKMRSFRENGWTTIWTTSYRKSVGNKEIRASSRF